MCARPIWLPQVCKICKAYTAGSLESAQGNTMTETRGKSIPVTKDVHDRLTARGKFKDSYNDIIKRLLDDSDSLTELEKERGFDSEGEETGEEEGSQ